MATRSKGKLAALNKENCEEHPWSNLAQNSNVPRSQEDYITHVSEEIEGRVTKKLSQEFSKTENRILGALAQLDDFLMNPLFQSHSGTLRRLPGSCLVLTRVRMRMTPRVTLILKLASSTTKRQITLATKIATTRRQDFKEREREREREREGERESGCVYGHDMVRGVHEEVTYCSLITSLRKQKKNHSISQPQFRSENSPATIEADQILLALQQLANNNNSANLHNNNIRISNLPKSLTTTMPTFDRKSESSS